MGFNNIIVTTNAHRGGTLPAKSLVSGTSNVYRVRGGTMGKHYRYFSILERSGVRHSMCGAIGNGGE